MSDSAADATRPADPVIRKLWRFDQEAISAHFARLDAVSRRMRFGGIVGEDFVQSYADQILTLDAVIYGAFQEQTLRGIAELRRLSDGYPAIAEAAFSVEPDWQNQGIGNALIARVIAAAQNRGIRSLYMMCLRENERMLHLAEKQHAVLHFHRSEIEATLDPSGPTPFSIAREMLGEADGFVDAVLRW